MNKNLLLFFFTVIFACILVSCVKDVDFSGAYEKKVVVNCILQSRAKYFEITPDYASRIPPTIQYEQQTDFDIQHLYLSYNCKDTDGNLEKVVNATAILYDNISGEKIGEFQRVSNYEWQLHYHIPYEVIDDIHKKYNLDYRLEITGISDNVISAYSSLKRDVCTEAIRITFADFLYYMTEDIEGPMWITCMAFDKQTLIDMPRDTPNYFELGRVEEKWINSLYNGDNPCPYADNFNYNDISSVYAWAIRLLPSAVQRHEQFMVYCKSGSSYHEMLLNFVSDDYDKFLKESIIYKMRKDDEADPTAHLYEDHIFSNIKGGVGIFGIEASYIFSRPAHESTYPY